MLFSSVIMLRSTLLHTSDTLLSLLSENVYILKCLKSQLHRNEKTLDYFYEYKLCEHTHKLDMICICHKKIVTLRSFAVKNDRHEINMRTHIIFWNNKLQFSHFTEKKYTKNRGWHSKISRLQNRQTHTFKFFYW